MILTNVYRKNIAAAKTHDVIVNQGGTSSGKTFSILQIIHGIADVSDKPLIISVCAESLPHLKRGAMRTYFDKFLKPEGIYKPENHKKTDHTYHVNNSLIEFFSVEDELKVRGARRDILFGNEVNKWPYETFTQLDVRTEKKTFLDFNPTREFWVHEKVIPMENCAFIKSTYLDALDVLPKKIVEKIELRKADKRWWKVFGEGEIGAIDIDNAWCYNYSEDRHVVGGRSIPRSAMFSSVFDYNVNPFVSLHNYSWFDKDGHHVVWIDEHDLMLKDVLDGKDMIETKCDRIKEKFPAAWRNTMIMSDATGRGRNVAQKKGMHPLAIIKRELAVSSSRMKVPRANPRVADNRQLVNSVFASHPDFVFLESMKGTRFELQYTEADTDGGIAKKDRNKMEQRADKLDCVRYFINAIMPDFIDRPQKYGVKN